MSDRIGIVVSNENSGLARVATFRSPACGGCGTSSGGCPGCSSGAKVISLVTNPVGAKSGDTVRVKLDSKELLKGAMILYLLPVVTLLAGALAGAGIGADLGWHQTAGSVSGGLLGLFLGFLMVKLIDRSRWVRRRLSPSITAVIQRSTESVNLPNAPAPGCCG